jgi:hypothetical protein
MSTVWEMLRDALKEEHALGHEWLGREEIVRAVVGRNPEANPGTVRVHVSAMCINDPSRNSYPGKRYLNNPLLVADDPTMRGKRFRLLNDGEREAFLARRRDDLDSVSYTQLLEWMHDPTVVLTEQVEIGDAEDGQIQDEAFVGVALFELHLQDYLHRNWRSVFPKFELYQGARGREFTTYDPGVGTLDFLARDADGNFVVIETKRNVPDRQAIGQVLGYMGWVRTKLCTGQQTVRGILIAGEATDRLRMAVAAVPNLALYLYEVSFSVKPDAPEEAAG